MGLYVQDYQFTRFGSGMIVGRDTDVKITEASGLLGAEYSDAVVLRSSHYGADIRRRYPTRKISLKFVVKSTDTAAFNQTISNLQFHWNGQDLGEIYFQIPGICEGHECFVVGRTHVKVTMKRSYASYNYCEGTLEVSCIDPRMFRHAVNSAVWTALEAKTLTNMGNAPGLWHIYNNDDTYAIPSEVSFTRSVLGVQTDLVFEPVGSGDWFRIDGFQKLAATTAVEAAAKGEALKLQYSWITGSPWILQPISQWFEMAAGTHSYTLDMTGTYRECTLVWRDAWL